MNGQECWGIFRERAHSPGREFDDAEILRLTGKHLDAMGFHVSLKAPDDLPTQVSGPPPVVFMMCEQTGILDRLRQWEQRGARIVNSPVAVLNTYRERMTMLLDQAHVAVPVSRIVPTKAASLTCNSPVWVNVGMCIARKTATSRSPLVPLKRIRPYACWRRAAFDLLWFKTIFRAI
jgi:hypothetical protein